MSSLIGPFIAAATALGLGAVILLRYLAWRKEQPSRSFMGVGIRYMPGADPYHDYDLEDVILEMYSVIPHIIDGVWIEVWPAGVDSPTTPGGFAGRDVAAGALYSRKFLPFSKSHNLLGISRMAGPETAIHEAVYHLSRSLRGLPVGPSDHAIPELKALEKEVLAALKKVAANRRALGEYRHG